MKKGVDDSRPYQNFKKTCGVLKLMPKRQPSPKVESVALGRQLKSIPKFQKNLELTKINAEMAKTQTFFKNYHQNIFRFETYRQAQLIISNKIIIRHNFC